MNAIRAAFVRLSTLALLALPSLGQSGGFQVNDLFVYAQVPVAPTFAGILRIDPLTGQGGVLVPTLGVAPGGGTLEFDPYRKRLVYLASQPGFAGSKVLMVDGYGVVTQLSPGLGNWIGLSPTGDGRIYFNDLGALGGVEAFKWVDAANQVHVLYDQDGVTPFHPPAFASGVADMIWDAGQNALIMASSWGDVPCSPGGSNSRVFVRKVPLSADGTRVAGGTSCAEYDVDPTDGEICAGLSRLPGGDLLLGTHNGNYSVELPRLLRVNPATLAITPYASFKDASNGGSAYSTALGQAVALDGFKSMLLAYSQGQVNNGVSVPSTVALPTQAVVVTEIPASACGGGWIAYGQGLAGQGGIVPRIFGEGCATPSGLVTLHIDRALGGTGAVLLFGFAPASLPALGGTLLVSPPFGLVLNVGVAGAPGVAGAGTFDLPFFVSSDPGLVGVSIYVQAGIGDAAAPMGISLTQGLELEIG